MKKLVAFALDHSVAPFTFAAYKDSSLSSNEASRATVESDYHMSLTQTACGQSRLGAPGGGHSRSTDFCLISMQETGLLTSSSGWWTTHSQVLVEDFNFDCFSDVCPSQERSIVNTPGPEETVAFVKNLMMASTPKRVFLHADIEDRGTALEFSDLL